MADLIAGQRARFEFSLDARRTAAKADYVEKLERTQAAAGGLLDKLEFNKKKESVAIHVPCSSKKMGIEASFLKVASLCADKVTPSGIPCCGMAGDRGMRYPELTANSLQHLKPNLPGDCTDGYSTSRTCEMSLSNHSGINFRGLVYLVDECTTAKKQAAQ